MQTLLVRKLIPLVVIVLLVAAACATDGPGGDGTFREDMRAFVQAISAYAKSESAGFIIIPQNGHELVTVDGTSSGVPAAEYLTAVDGVGREDLNYGFDGDNIATTEVDRNAMIPFLDVAEANGVEVLVTDYCSDTAKMDDSYAANLAMGYTSFAADSRDLDTVPAYPSSPIGVNTGVVTTLGDAANFLYMLDPSQYGTKGEYLGALAATNFDLIIMDLFYEDASGIVSELTASDIAGIGTKQSGEPRLLICYMSIGEAEDYRYYWNTSWEQDKPTWLEGENPSWPGNHKVQYWNLDWQALIFGSIDAYLDKILTAGFDGVYLDIIDAYEYFEG